jgi:hypothetical protein
MLKRRQELFQNRLKTPEREPSTDNTIQMYNYGNQAIEPPPIMQRVEN